MIGLSHTDVLVLCGGMGTRLRSAIGERQKTMADINGHPFLDLLLAVLIRQQVRRVILCAGYQAHSIEEHYRRHSLPLDIHVVNESEPLGTGGAVKNAAAAIQSEIFFVLNGDSFCDITLADVVAFHREKRAVASMVVVPGAGEKEYGTVELDRNDQITAFREKESGQGGLVNAGIYCMSKGALALMPDQMKFSMEYDVFPGLIGKGFFGFRSDARFWDIGTPERLARAAADLKAFQGDTP